MTESNVWQLLLWQMVQITVLALVLGAIASRVSRWRPHFAHILLLVLLVKTLTPPLVTSPWATWGTRQVPSVWAEAKPSQQLATSSSALTTMPIPADAALTSSKPTLQGGSLDLPATATPSPGQPLVFRLGLVIWGLGTIVVMGLAVLQWGQAVRHWGKLEVCARGQATATRLAAQLALSRVPRVVVDDRNYGPLVSGWWRPQIVLPRCLVEGGNQEEIDLAIAHELIHVRRGDTVISVLQHLACAVWWFHPLVWWANRVLDRTTELCCDEEVIASLGCKPVKYARCLVEIAAQKQQVQHVAMVPGTRPAAITASRLSRLGRPRSAFLQRTPWSCWFVFMLMAILVVPTRSLGTRVAAEEPTRSQPAITISDDARTTSERAAAALAAEDYETAARQYRQLVTENPNSGLAWYRLGYALHAMGQLDDAIEAHRRAMNFPPTRATANYNLACALALQGKTEEAMAELAAAIDAGFRARQAPLGDDPDLAALLDHPDFSSLADRASETQTSPYRQLDFMVGDWQVHNAAGRLLGHSTISKEEEGFLLREKWQAAGGSTGTGITYFHPKQKVWRQTFVGMFGSVIDMQGAYERDALRMAGETALPNATVSLVRASTTPHGDGTFQFLMEESRDGGETWQTTFDGLYSPH